MMETYRKYIYENSKGDKLHLNESGDAFLYNVSGMGYAYQNEISQTEYDTLLELQKTDISREPVAGTYLISGDKNEDIYQLKRYAEGVLNYDQIINRTQNKRIRGKLYYQNALGQPVFAYVLIKDFKFGEIAEDSDELEINLSFDMLSKNWISEQPKVYSIDLNEDIQYFQHPYGHPFGHVDPDAGYYKRLSISISGNDVAYITVSIEGEVRGFRMEIMNEDGTSGHRIKYKNEIPAGSVMELNMIDIYTRQDGENCISGFDIVNYDIPFFYILPGRYTLKFGAEYLNGRVAINIFESWVSG